MIGKTLGHYRIEAQLGEGGMGVVYRARDTRLGRDVALKFVSDSPAAKNRPPEQLLNEARAASALNHPNIAHIYDVGEIEGRGYIAMEYVRGQPLGGQIPGEGLPVEMVARYGSQIAAALAHAHEHGVIHRDLKSANVVITPEGQAKVLDFGLAQRLGEEELAEATKSLETREPSAGIAGTLHYMAPELLRAQPPDQRSDIWALGVVLYEMATGKLPFRGNTGFELTSAILREQPATISAPLPAGLRSVIQRCLAKEPGQRFQLAGEVRASLDMLSSDVAIPAVGAIGARPWWRRQFVYWTVALLALVGLGIWKGPYVLSIGRTATGPRLSTGGKASANKEANEYFEKGMFFLSAQIDLARAQQMFERALQLDPKFAEARGWYGFSLLLQVDIGYSNDSIWLYKAEEQIKRTLEDDPQNGHSHTTLAAIHYYGNRKELLRAELDKALKINPEDFDAEMWLAGSYYFTNGDYEAAKKILQPILERQPLLTPARSQLADVLREEGDTAASIREYEKIREQDPQSPWLVFLARTHIYTGDLAAARTVLEGLKPSDRKNFQNRMVWALLLAKEGKRELAVKEMDDEVLKYAALNPYYTTAPAEFYAIFNETDKALEWMERAVNKGDERAEWFQRDPLLANIRKEPRFQQILNSIAFRRQQHGH